MSVQNALQLIQDLRNRPAGRPANITTLEDLVQHSNQQNLPATTADFKKAFQVDWDIRWLQFSRNLSQINR
ncbi:hypothetical protein [Chitinophaga rhizosphaerae]|uniref:hypothetical protein n=1 Tax=Chitinophaga rhizosphaerae TaxID=1864947 RepID=UPI000F7FC8DD|nr:hypothetical protein [Chitinophaga rhizosphaerae]